MPVLTKHRRSSAYATLRIFHLWYAMAGLLVGTFAGLAIGAMDRPTAALGPPLRICIAQMVGITAPAIYSSLTFAYSHMVVPPLVAHASEKLLAKQWLQAYQYAANFVPPLIISGTLTNAYLAYLSPNRSCRLQYSAAMLLVFSIIPWTLLVFEPGINGASKWKVQQLLQDEGFDMPIQKGPLPSPDVHTGSFESRHWAENSRMKELAEEWAKRNAKRYMVTFAAMLLSMAATCKWLSGKQPLSYR